MKIAQVAPLNESVPPKLYGGTERVVSYLTEELVQQGHDVTLFASGDSETKARLVAACPQSLRLNEDCIDQMAHHVRMMNMVFEQARQFDILHFHIDYMHYPLSVRQKTPYLTTLHGRLDLPDLISLYRDFRNIPLVSISNSQRKPLAWANWLGTVYHGLPDSLYRLSEKPRGYLAFIGRISPEKRVDRAIEIAKGSGRQLRIAAKVDVVDDKYFHEAIEPLLKDPRVEFLGEIGEEEKGEFLSGAGTLLLPIDWPEPFGLVMIEAMACGTPVIAWREGSAPEVIEGITGFVVASVEEAASAVDKAASLDRREVRKMFETRFSARRMAREYVAIYESLLSRDSPRVAA